VIDPEDEYARLARAVGGAYVHLGAPGVHLNPFDLPAATLVAYESRLELARIMLADFDPAVTAIAAQPFRLAGPDGAGCGVTSRTSCWR
jgi:hypothetical protein